MNFLIAFANLIIFLKHFVTSIKIDGEFHQEHNKSHPPINKISCTVNALIKLKQSLFSTDLFCISENMVEPKE